MISPDDWVPADDLTLEPSALTAATELNRNLALTAGPGAGKTEMLAQRADFLLRTASCRYPKRILAISFKVDASRNLKERVMLRCGADLACRFDSYTFHAFAKKIIDRFRLLLTGTDALDADYSIGDRRVSRRQITFDDLVPLAVQILRHSHLAKKAVRHTYSDVFLDEFQDCTNRQYELVQVAFRGTPVRITAVGDTKQKIMAWAGAMDGIFEQYCSDFGATALNMYRNFRSAPKLLRLQNEIIRVLDPASVMPDDQLVGEEGELIAWHYQDSKSEAEHLTQRIDEWIQQELTPISEIAILVSKQLDLYAQELMEALEAKGIPFRNEQDMQDISTEPVARLVVDYLSCVYGDGQAKAWQRLCEKVLPFELEDGRLKITQDLQQFIQTQRRLARAEIALGHPVTGWWNLVSAFLKYLGIETLSALSPDYESANRLKEVLSGTKQRVEKLLVNEPNLVVALKSFEDDQSIRILTIHKSKGLEFDTVILLGVEEQTFWGKADEERCAFFVGVSRAKRRLILTTCATRARPGGARRWDTNRTPHAEFCGYAVNLLQGQS